MTQMPRYVKSVVLAKNSKRHIYRVLAGAQRRGNALPAGIEKQIDQTQPGRSVAKQTG